MSIRAVKCAMHAVALLILACGCGQGVGTEEAKVPTGEKGAEIVKSEATAKGPVGLFFMTRFWAFNGMLEKSVWYFSPDGKFYENLLDGFSKEDLAAHKGKQGTYSVTGDQLEVVWSDGKKTKSKYEPDKTGFSWDMGIFTPVQPFADGASLAGTYEGGEAVRGSGGAAAVSKTLELRADGTYKLEGVSSVRSETAASTVSAGAQTSTEGTWKVSGYSLTLSGKDGQTLRKIAFPYDDDKTKMIYFGGTMYKKK